MLFVALVIFIFNIFIATDIARWLGVTRSSFALVMSMGILISGYSVLFNVLSQFHGISFITVLIFEILFISIYVFKRGKFIKDILKDLLDLIKTNKLYFLILLPLLLLLSLSAFLMPPNNNDSLSYHLARVVHWIQNGDIGYYYTSIDRQNRMGPGAEMLILLLQLISNSDRLAVLVQLLSFLFICISLPDILKLFGVNKTYALLICLFTISTPMLLFQAVTTQNDLVSSLLTWAIVLLLLKLYKQRIENISLKYFVLIGVILASAYLSKPTSLLALIPFILFIAVVSLRKNGFKYSIIKVSIAIIMFAFIGGPDIYRKNYASKELKTSFDDVLYPITKEWNSSRAFNVFLAGMHHSPLDLSQNETIIHQAAKLISAKFDAVSIQKNWVHLPHEDYIGNPIQFIALLILSLINVIALILSRTRSKYLIALLPFISFLIMGLFIKDNPWISRLQLPFFTLMPLCFVGFASVNSKLNCKIYMFALIILAFISLVLGTWRFSQNLNRPLSLNTILNPPDPISIYFHENMPLKPDHDTLMRLCEENKVRTVGIITEPFFLEYLFGWELHQKGIPLKHVKSNDFRDADIVYLEKPTAIEYDSKIYEKLSERFFIKRRTIQALTKANSYTFSQDQLFLEGGGAIRQLNNILFYGNGTITSQKIALRKGNYAVCIRSNGALVEGAGSHWVVKLSNNKIGELSSVAMGQTDTLHFEVSQEGEYELKMEFDNDIYDKEKGLDRNGEIEAITIIKRSN